jgi:hypothetical protein
MLNRIEMAAYWCSICAPAYIVSAHIVMFLNPPDTAGPLQTSTNSAELPLKNCLQLSNLQDTTRGPLIEKRW